MVQIKIGGNAIVAILGDGVIATRGSGISTHSG